MLRLLVAFAALASACVVACQITRQPDGSYLFRARLKKGDYREYEMVAVINSPRGSTTTRSKLKARVEKVKDGIVAVVFCEQIHLDPTTGAKADYRPKEQSRFSFTSRAMPVDKEDFKDQPPLNYWLVELPVRATPIGGQFLAEDPKLKDFQGNVIRFRGIEPKRGVLCALLEYQLKTPKGSGTVYLNTKDGFIQFAEFKLVATSSTYIGREPVQIPYSVTIRRLPFSKPAKRTGKPKAPPSRR